MVRLQPNPRFAAVSSTLRSGWPKNCRTSRWPGADPARSPPAPALMGCDNFRARPLVYKRLALRLKRAGTQAPAVRLRVAVCGRTRMTTSSCGVPICNGSAKFAGARGRSRTDTLLRAADFESAASTNSATRALRGTKGDILTIRLVGHNGGVGPILSERVQPFGGMAHLILR